MRVPRLLGEPGARVRLHGGRDRAAPGARGRRDRAASPSRPTCRSPRGARTCACAPSSGCTRATDFTFTIRSQIPLVGRARLERRRDRRGPDGRRPHVRARRGPARARERARGAPRQRRAPRSRRLRRLRRRPGRRALEPPDGPRGARGRAARRRCARTPRAPRCPPRCRCEDAVFNVAHAALLMLGLARGDWDLVARGLARPPAPAAARARSSRARSSSRSARRELGALGATHLRRGADGARVVLLRADGRGRARRSQARSRGWAHARARPVRVPGRLRRASSERAPARARARSRRRGRRSSSSPASAR